MFLDLKKIKLFLKDTLYTFEVGKCSGFPICCIFYFILIWPFNFKLKSFYSKIIDNYNFGYVPCPIHFFIWKIFNKKISVFKCNKTCGHNDPLIYLKRINFIFYDKILFILNLFKNNNSIYWNEYKFCDNFNLIARIIYENFSDDDEINIILNDELKPIIFSYKNFIENNSVILLNYNKNKVLIGTYDNIENALDFFNLKSMIEYINN